MTVSNEKSGKDFVIDKLKKEIQKLKHELTEKEKEIKVLLNFIGGD